MKFPLVILGMALVTYLPRLIPSFFMDRIQFPSWFERWLRGIPFAVLGALIFPGILLVEKDQPLIGVAGGITALLLALLNLHITLVMIGTIISVMLFQYFIF
jgi:branched-subunit amino acid transport protein